MSNNTLVFSVRALDVSIDASLATIGGVDSESFTSDVTSMFQLSVANAKDMFRFQSDAVDIDDVIANDLRYKLVYTEATKDNGVPNAEWVLDPFIQRTDCIESDNNDPVYTAGTQGATNKNIASDYLRYLAYKLFNTHLGVDLFNNEEEFALDMNNQARIALDNLLSSISEYNEGGWVDASDATVGFANQFSNAPHPTYVIVQHLLNNNPARFHDMSNNFISGNENDTEFYVPFIAGDFIQFQLTVNADANQTNVVDDAITAIPTRTYKIKIELID